MIMMLLLLMVMFKLVVMWRMRMKKSIVRVKMMGRKGAEVDQERTESRAEESHNS